MIDEAAFEAAAQLVHGNYSEKPWGDRESYAERIWARGTLRAAIEKLALTDTIADAEQARAEAEEAKQDAREAMQGFRAISLSHSDTLTRIWAAAGGDATAGYGVDASQVVEQVRSALREARTQAPKIEITDTAVNDMALWFWGPSALYDREALRTALANALQTR